MAGGAAKYRHLSRKSSHRQALLRNLVDSLFEHESITTTWPKAKEAQRLADKLITLGKRNTETARRSAQAVFWRPNLHLPKLFGELRERYANRPGGYTRVLRVEPKKEDQAPSAILEFVDGPHDMRFTLTARTLAYRMKNNLRMNDITQLNIKKVTRYRADGEEKLKDLVDKFRKMGNTTYVPPAKKRVYPDPMDVESLRRAKRMEKHEKEKPWW